MPPEPLVDCLLEEGSASELVDALEAVGKVLQKHKLSVINAYRWRSRLFAPDDGNSSTLNQDLL